jgi:uncharacterized membrane protein YhhN
VPAVPPLAPVEPALDAPVLGPWITLAGLVWGLWGVFRGAGRPAARGRALGKLLASAGFLTFAWELGLPGAGPVGLAASGALALSALGDAALIEPGRGRGFALGLGAFCGAHLAYALGFWGLDPDPRHAGLGLLVLAPVALAFDRWLVGTHPDPPRAEPISPRAEPGAWLPWIRLYSLALAAMAAGAAGVAAGPGGAWLLAGAAAFLISDLFVSRERFGRDDRWNLGIGWPLYFGAQLALAYGTHRALTG